MILLPIVYPKIYILRTFLLISTKGYKIYIGFSSKKYPKKNKRVSTNGGHP